jgi:hypothetical protein
MKKVVISVRDAIGTGGGEVALKTAKGMCELGFDVIIVSDYSVNINGSTNIVLPFGDFLKKINNVVFFYMGFFYIKEI